MKKLSYRDIGEMVADSAYYSTPAHRSMSEISKKFPGYNDIKSPSHDQAIAYVLEQTMPFIDSSCRGHSVDKSDVIQKFKKMVSEGMA